MATTTDGGQDADTASSDAAHAAVDLRGLTRRFGSVTAVDDIDLTIRDGEFFSMLGPSGSGKTTVLRMIAGFEIPDSGTVRLDGVDVTRQAPFERNVNTVFQDYALFPHMNVRDNVAYGLRVRGVAKARRRELADAALAKVRLDSHGDRKASQLSGGQRQRVALARALVIEPKVLLLDEPLGALDLKLREEMQVELKVLQRDVGITFVFVTHDQDEALTMSDRIAVFNNGRIEQIGSAAEIYEQPASSFVAGFVGTSNLITGAAAKALFGHEGTFSVRPEKIHIDPRSAVAGGSRRHVGQGNRGGGGLRGRVHALHRRPRRRSTTRGSAAEPAVVIDGRARLSRQAGAAQLASRALRRDRRSSQPLYVGGLMTATHPRRIGRRTATLAVLASLALVASGCGTSSDNTTSQPGAGGFKAPDIPMATSVGKGEGKLNVLAWPGYAESGKNDPSVDWVTPFEEKTGCQVNVKEFGTSDEAVSLMHSGGYDVVSASGDATLRLIAASDVQPINTDLVPNYTDISAFLKDKDFNSVDGQMWGIPHGWGANLLMYNKDVVKPAPTDWNAVFNVLQVLRRQGDGVRLADLHRRRCALLDEHPAEPRHQEPLRARPAPVAGCRRRAQDAEGEHRRVLVGLHQGGAGLQERVVGHRDHLAGDRQPDGG